MKLISLSKQVSANHPIKILQRTSVGSQISVLLQQTPCIMPIRKVSCTRTSNQPICCWISKTTYGSPTSAWPSLPNRMRLPTGDIVGTPQYMPPESFEGRYDVRSEVYALGLTLYEMLLCAPQLKAMEQQTLSGKQPRESLYVHGS